MDTRATSSIDMDGDRALKPRCGGCARNPLHCIIPTRLFERLAESPDPATRQWARDNLVGGAQVRAVRSVFKEMPMLAAFAASGARKHRMVYIADGNMTPGTLARAEGDPKHADKSVNEAYDYSGKTYDFYDQIFKRNSLDGRGMQLISSVHYTTSSGRPVANAYWNGKQMLYGDGAAGLFKSFTASLDVVAHELTHGVQSFESNLDYYGESGALNEHFSDVFGILVRQWSKKLTAAKSDWLIGADLMVAAPTRRALRDMENPGTAFTNDPLLGSDDQPAHMRKFYRGTEDDGGVHINSGIPNRAFVLAAKDLGGYAWNAAGRIWYDTMRQLSQNSDFAHFADICRQVAQQHGARSSAAVDKALKAVGL